MQYNKQWIILAAGVTGLAAIALFIYKYYYKNNKNLPHYLAHKYNIGI